MEAHTIKNKTHAAYSSLLVHLNSKYIQANPKNVPDNPSNKDNKPECIQYFFSVVIEQIKEELKQTNLRKITE